MRIAIIGCGFVADYYLKTLSLHPNLRLCGLMDSDHTRSAVYSKKYSAHCYNSLEEVLEDKNVDLVVNLTTPFNHYEISKACLESNKHVYTEKPMCLNFSDAEKLVQLAESKHLLISSAPCSLLGETAQTIWKILRENKIGDVRLVYAQIDDGLLYKMHYKKWFNSAGIPWPYKNEIETGCTLEHSAYYISWLVAFFGPAVSVTAFSSCQIPNKLFDTALTNNAPDFSVACIKFASGVVARLTCSIIAPKDHSLLIIGDEGNIQTKECWDYNSAVYLRRRITIRRKTIETPWKTKCRLMGGKQKSSFFTTPTMDYCRGISEMANSIKEERSCRISPRFSLHVNEVALAISNASEDGTNYKISTSFEPIQPMPWAV